MGIRNEIIAALAIAASMLALASIVCTDSYSSAAQAEAHGYHALTQVMRSAPQAADVGLSARVLSSNRAGALAQ